MTTHERFNDRRSRRMNVCQWCDERVMWMPRPLDADFAAFAHADTGLVACASDTYQGRQIVNNQPPEVDE